MSANDFFASLTKQAREKDRTVSKSSTVNSKAATVSAPATDADTFFSSLNRQAQFIDRNGFTPKTLANVGNVSKEASAAKAPLLSGYEERSFGDTVRDIGTVVGGAILQGADAAATGISSTLDFLIGRPLQALGWENNPASWLNDKLQSEREANAEYFNQQLEGNEAAQTALDLGTAVTRAAWELPLIIMTGGASKAAQAGTKGLQATAALESTLQSSGIGQTVTNAVNLLQRQLRNPQTWQSFASTTGQAYEDAKAQGASEASATAYAVINGLLGSLVEVGGGGIQELPDVLRQPSRLRNWIDTMLDEGKEEVVQGVIDRLTQNVTGVANNPIVGSGDDNAVFNLGTALEEFGGGALVGGILGGGQIGVDAALNRIRGNTSQNATEAPTTGTAPQTGVDTSTGVNPVEAGIEASVRLFNEGGGVIDAQTPGDSRYMKESAPETIKTVVPSQSEARGGSGAPTESAPDNIKTGVTAQDGVTGGSGTLSNNRIPDSGQNVNGQETTSDGRATPSSAFDTVSPPADASITVPGENVNALADSMTDEQLALEQQRNNADIASINDVLNAAQGGQQFPQGIIDQLTGQLPGLMQEQQRLASIEQAKRVQRGEVSRSFGQPENHIDNRNPDSVKGNRVAAFSFDHPQLHGYFVQAARDLQGMADYAAEAERGRSNRGNRIDRERNRSAVEHAYSRELRNAMESGDLSKPQVLDACQRIIDNHGQENVLAAKRVELILDDMLTNGYTTADGVDVAPNMEYIAAKEQIAGARGAERAIQRYDDDLAIGALGMPYTDAELAEQEVERQRIRDQYAALNQPAAQTSQNGEVSATDSLGAAPRGFGAEGDALTMQLEQAADAYGTMPARNGLAREVPLPNSMDGNTRVMRTAQTLADAEAIDSTASGRVADDVARGVYNYTPERNADVMAEDLNQLAGQDLQSAAREWIVEASQNIVTRRTATRGVNLMRQAQAAGDYNLMSDLMAAFAQHQHNAASALQVSRMFWELPREMQLATIQKSVDRLNTGEDAGYSRRQSRQIAGQDAARRMLRDMEQQRDDALNVLAEIANAYRGEAETGEADWIGQIANGLAANLSSRLRTQRSGQMPIGRIMVQDMVRLAEQYALPRQRRGQTQRRSAIETLQNYIYNRAEYDAAWQRAQEEIRQRYQNSPEALAAFDEWLNSSAPYEGSAITQSPMFRAIVEEAAAQELNRNTVAVRAEYGDAELIADELTRRVTSQLDGVTQQDQFAIYDAALEYVNSRTPTGDRTASDVVESRLRQAMRDAGVRMSEIIRQGASTKAEVASNLSQALVNEFGFSEQNARTFAADVVDRFNTHMAEASQRALESRFRDRTATQRRGLTERLTELANMGAFSSDQFNNLATRQLFGRDLPPEIRVDEALIQNFMTAESAEAQADAMNAIYKNIAEQIPQNWYEKIDNWRYFMMLFNPETHLRNKLGNVAYTPIRGLDYRLSAFLQDRLIRDPEQRTRANINRRNAEDEARYQAGLAEFDLVDSMYASPGKYSNARGGIRQNAPTQLPFGLERTGLGKLVELNSQALENADAKTSSKAYAYSLAQWLKAHDITAEQYLAPDFDPDLKAQAQGFALNEGRRATFRDVNDFINVLQQASHLRGNNPIVQAYNTAMSAVNPFARTGGNLIVRAAEHSPLGLVRGTYNAMRYLWNQRNAVAEQRYSAGEVLDQITQGLTGTGVLLLGALLMHLGWITGGDAGDDKETEFAEQQGWQPYSLKIGDGYYSIDWLAPMALPLFTGVELYQQFWGDHAGDNDWLGALGRIADPMLEMSMMSSISGLFDSIAYADGNSLWPIAASIASNYIGQFFPSLGGAIERIGTDTRQTTYTNPDGALPTDVQYTISNALNRIPGVDFQQTDYIDAWGRKQETGSALYRAFDNLANPGTYSADRSTEVDAELQRLYDVTGVDVFPSRVSPNETYTKKNNDGTVEEIHLADSGLYETYATMLGQTSLSELTELINSAAYQSMTDADKAVAVQAIYDYARDVARKAVDSEYEMSSKNEEAQEFAGGAPTYFSFNTAWKAVENSKGADTAAFDAVMEDYANMDVSEQNALMEALGEGTRFDDVVGAYEAGIDPERWYEAYDKHQELNENENLSANSAATEFAKWLDTESGFNANQRDVIEEQMRFWNMFPADTERYDALIDAGFTPEKADAVYDAVSALQPQQGKTQVSDLQRYEAIANMSGLTDAEKVQALTEYEGASSGDRQKFSTAYAYGISPELYVNMLEMQDEGVGDEDGNGRYKQDEAKLLIDTLMDSNSDMTTREAAILWAMLCPTSKTGNPYGNIYGSTSMEWDYAP